MRSIYINRYEYIRSTVIDRGSGGINPRVF